MKDKEQLLNRITRYLMLHASSMNNIGLLNGKLGVCIFFYEYSQYTHKKYYSDFAGELLDEVYSEIHSNYSRDFKDGLSGVCWGFEYIIRNQYVLADSNEVLEDLDMQILERDVRRVTDISLDTGLNGLAHYVLSRCVNRPQNKNITIDYVTDLIKSLQKNNGDNKLIVHLTDLVNNEPSNYRFDLLTEIKKKNKYRGDNIFTDKRLGIMQNGLTGVALSLLKK